MGFGERFDVEADDVWDRWRAARAVTPKLDPAAFSRRYGDDAPAVLQLLQVMLAIGEEAPPSALVDIGPTGDGPLFAGFRLVEVIGEGATGIVYRAKDERASGAVSVQVAIKILNPLLDRSASRRDAILHEARIAQSLEHRGIVGVIASGVERGYSWIATEYVDGETLDRALRRVDSARVRAEFALDVGRQVAAALEHAHARGVVHCDLKPANLIRARTGEVRVLDFGLARAYGSAFAMSRTGETFGTPLYMAPEQASGRGQIGPWTDVYALGLVLCEIGTGRTQSFDGDMPTLLARVAAGRFRMPRTALRALPEGLRSVVSRCMEPVQADRYPDCTALRLDLENVIAGRAPRLGALGTVPRLARKVLRNRGRAFGVAAATTACASAAALAWWHRPVEVVFRAYENGKQVWIDGQHVGLDNVRLRLRPGTHSWTARFGSASEEFEGAFEVESGTPLFVTEFLSPWYGVPVAPIELPPLTRGSFANVVLACPDERIHLALDGRAIGTVAGIVCLKLATGAKYVVEASRDDGARWTRELTLDDQRLRFLPFELDDPRDNWRTVLVYSPIDEGFEGLTHSRRDMRLFVESEANSAIERLHVRRAYLGPSANGLAHAELLLRIPLPVVVSEFEVEVGAEDWATGSEAWARLEMGAELQSMVEVAFHGLGRGDTNTGRSIGPSNSLRRRALPDEVLEPLRARLRGKRELWVRYSLGNAAISQDVAYASAVRANALPHRLLDGTLLWSPALRIRVKD